MRERTKYIIAGVVVMFIFTLFWFSLSDQLFKDPVCTVLLDKDGYMLGAHIADDGQWRFPYNKNVPEKFKKAIITFEDKRFENHVGIDPFALLRALLGNIKSGERQSGASTLTMQVIRLSRKDKPRTIWEKIKEMYFAFRLDFSHNKNEILALYSSNAPFGGNVVGLDAAAWRYFGRSPDKLSWSESCLLAVLPNSPALIHPGKNRTKLQIKRNRLLKKLFTENIIDKETYELSIIESIPDKPHAFPHIAPHLLMRANMEFKKLGINSTINTTININIQNRVNQILQEYHNEFKGNGIWNAAALILEVESGNVLAYAGNINNLKDKKHGFQVDIITSKRSTGSILKPFLYAAMLSEGDILPHSLVADIPTNISGYAPKNYSLGYDGAVPASRALARSLNIPAVRMLRNYGISKFIFILKKIGINTVNKTADHYGLSLILGGCEGTLWELTGAYASIARVLNHYTKKSSQYNDYDYFPPKYLNTQYDYKESWDNASFMSASAIWFTFDAMLDVDRPDEEGKWQYFSSSQKIAWKTGTSFGFRDGWAIGVTPEYVVGVWVGNADGEGRPTLTGINTAGPVMFKIFNILPASSKWFDTPFDDMEKLAICNKSGYLASEYCTQADTNYVPVTGIRFNKCPYHQIIHLDPAENFRVHSDCEDPINMVHKSWFILPPAMEWYYKSKNSQYKVLPPYRPDCNQTLIHKHTNTMEIIYPKDPKQIYIPIEIDGTRGSTIFEVAHRDKKICIFWHIDNEFIGQTKDFHQLAVSPEKGKHILTLIDENGEKVTQVFEIIDKKN